MKIVISQGWRGDAMGKKTRVPVRNRLKQVRHRRDLAIYGLSALSGVSPTILCAVERWGYCPGDEVRRRIAHALAVSVSDIWPEAEAQS
jgi:DNA-binding XRE family transcriptional regulator